MANSLLDGPIEMCLVATDFGMKIPKTEIGVSLIGGTYLRFKLGNDTYLYGIATLIDVGCGSHIFAHVSTDYFRIQNNKTRLTRIPRMDGLEAELKVSGLVGGPLGRIDIDFQVFDEFADKNNPILKVNRQNVKAEGILAVDLSVSGTLRKVRSKTHQEAIIV